MISKAAKYYDMRFNFLKCQEAQRQFDFVLRCGKKNRADYHLKRHPVKHYSEKCNREQLFNPLSTPT